MSIEIGDVIYPRELKRKGTLINFFATRPGVSEGDYRIVIKTNNNMIGLLCIDKDNVGYLDNSIYNTIEDLNATNIYSVAVAKEFLGFKILKV